MKKFLSLMLVATMILSVTFVMNAYATSVTINSKDIMAGGQGVGFFDNEENSTATEPESAGDGQIYLRGGEWVKYDIKEHNISAGTYEVSIKRRATAWARQRVFVDLYVDDTLVSKKNIEANVTSYSDMELGKVYIGEDSETIKLLNSGIYNDYYLWLESITLTFVSEENVAMDEYDISVHAHNIKSINLAESATSDGGYWDAAGCVLPNGSVIENNSYTQHAGDWSKYDISGLVPGTYNVYLEACSVASPNMTISIDGQVVYMDRAFESTGSYSVSREDELGQLYFNGTESELKINTTTAAVFLRGVRFEYVTEENLLLDTYLKIEAETPIPGGQNEAFYDNGAIPTRLDVLEIYSGATGNTICHRTDEWVKYKVANLVPGKYELSVSSSSKLDALFVAELNDEVVIEGTTVALQGSYEDFETNRLGYITIEDDSEYILKISMPQGLTYIDYYELNMVLPFETTGLKSNVSDDENIKRGSDVLIVSTNNKVNDSTYENAVVKDVNGKELLSSVSLSDDKKEIIISLKETLLYSSEYTIDLSEVTDEYEQFLSENSFITFVTSDKNADDGLASVDEVVKEKEENTLKIKGTVLSSNGLGIKGREVTLIKIYPDGEENTLKTTSKENGEFEFVLTYNNEDAKGLYLYEVTTEYAKEAKTIKDSFYGDELNEIICSAINDKNTWQEAKNALVENAEILGIDAKGENLEIEMEYVYKQFVNRSFEIAADVTDEFNRYVAIEKINQADNAEDVLKTLSDKEEGKLLNVNFYNWELLSDEEKMSVAEEIFEENRIDNKDVMAELIKDVIAKTVSYVYGASSPEINVTEKVEITEGSGGVLNIAFCEKTKDVKEIRVEISFEDDKVFKNEPIDVKTQIENADLKVSKENRKIIVDINRKYTLDDVKDICKITFTTLTGDSGTYDLKVSGYCVFTLDEAGEIEVDFPEEKSCTIKVNKKQTSQNKDYGGGKGGSSGGGGGSSYKDIPIDTSKPEETPKPQPTNEPKEDGYSDVSKDHWAKSAIDVLSKMGVISGRGNSIFDPEAPVTRGEFLKILLGAHKIEAGGNSSFNDVNENDWFYPYVSKALDLGIVNGDENGNFNPNGAISRQDMAVISYRLLSKNGNNLKSAPEFADNNDISDYAKEAVGSLYEMGMISGVGDNLFMPKKDVSRAMAAQFAYNMLYPKKIEKIEKTDVGVRDMAVTFKDGKLSVRTSFDKSNGLVQQFSGFASDNMNENAVINFGASGVTNVENENLFAVDTVFGSGVDEPAPFNINNAYIGANHGQPSGVLVKGTHNKTYNDIGSVWQDEAGTKWNLLKVNEDKSLLFISDNYGPSAYDYSFIRELKGNLTYVSDGVNKEAITVSSTSLSQQIYSSTNVTQRTVYAVVDGVGYVLEDGKDAICDYVDIVEKYEIINPATIADALRKNKPEGGYNENQNIAVGNPMVKYSMIYRITPDGTVTSIFDHEIVQDVNVNFYSGVMAQERNDAFGGGVYRYIPKVGEFTANGVTYNYTEPTDVTNGDVPDLVLGELYWEDEKDAPNREVSYMRNKEGKDEVLFADGYVPVYDGAVDVRSEKTNSWGFLYPTKKHYPYFVTSKAFENGTKGAHIKGVGYKKYESLESNLSKLGISYTVPFENDVYLYVDYQKAGTDEITLPDKLKNYNVELVEKSANISYNKENGEISVNVTDEKTYGYLVLKINGGGYGKNTYSEVKFNDKFIVK